jgi:hypothetical protein
VRGLRPDQHRSSTLIVRRTMAEACLLLLELPLRRRLLTRAGREGQAGELVVELLDGAAVMGRQPLDEVRLGLAVGAAAL